MASRCLLPHPLLRFRPRTHRSVTGVSIRGRTTTRGRSIESPPSRTLHMANEERKETNGEAPHRKVPPPPLERHGRVVVAMLPNRVPPILAHWSRLPGCLLYISSLRWKRRRGPFLPRSGESQREVGYRQKILPESGSCRTTTPLLPLLIRFSFPIRWHRNAGGRCPPLPRMCGWWGRRCWSWWRWR